MSTPANTAEEIRKNFKFNFTVNLLDVANFMFGSSFMSAGTVLPIYVTHFTKNPLVIGLISVVSTAGFLIPQIFTSNSVERLPQKKFYPFNLGFFFERVPVMLLAPSVLLFAVQSPALALVAFFFLLTWQNFGAGSINVAWQDMIAKIIPVQNRGKFFGLSNFLGTFTGILGASVASWLLGQYAFPTGFAIAFGCAAVFNFASWCFLGLTREPRGPTEKPAVSNLEYFKALPAVLRANPNFSRYLVTQIVSTFGAMASGFLLVYALETWSISDGQAATYNIALLLGQSAANLLLGFLADRKGHKLVLEIAILTNVAVLALALLASSPLWFYAVFALRGATLAGNFISGLSLPLEFSDPANRPTFIGLANTLPGIASTFAPLIAGLLANAVGYPVLFTLAGGITIAALLLMRFLVRDPRHVTPAVS
jgi:MFS family permease